MLTKREFFCTVILVLSILSAGGRGLLAASPESYRDAAVSFYDNVLKHGRDEYGRKTPLFADGIDVKAKTARLAPNGAMTSNFVFQQNLLRGLVALSRTTEDEKYHRAAAEATRHVLTHLVSPKSGLIYWGGHVYWDLKEDGPRCDPHNSHELKHDFPYYDFLYEVDPKATRKFIERYWLAHVDLKSPRLMFGRHAKMDQSKPRGRVSPRELAFTLSAADLFYAAAILFSKTQDPMWRDRAVTLAKGFADLKDPRTGLASELLGADDTGFDRPAYKLSMGHLGVGVPNLLIDYGRRSDSYALCQLYLSERLSGEPGDKFRAWAIEDLIAYAKHCYDPKGRAFFEMCRTDTGERIHFSQTRWYPADPKGHYIMPQRFYENKGLPLLFLAYVRGYKLSGDPAVKRAVETLLDLMEIRRGKPVDLSGVADEYLKSDFAACLIQGLLDLHETDRDPWHLEAARGIADDALRRFYKDGFFFDWPNDFQYSRVNQGLPLALTRLYTVLSGKRVDLPQDIGAYGMEGFRPNVISGIDGDKDLLYMWSKHHTDIAAGDISVRVGDGFPHCGSATGLFDHPGVWRLGTSGGPANILDDKKGMVFEPLRDVVPAEIRKLSDEEAAIEHWQFRRGSKKEQYFGIRMNYRVEAPNILNWTLEVTPLEEGYGDLSLRFIAYLNAKASSEKLVFKFKPDAPIEQLSSGPSKDNPGGFRGFVWHIKDAKKDQPYKLNVRIKVFR